MALSAHWSLAQIVVNLPSFTVWLKKCDRLHCKLLYEPTLLFLNHKM